MWRFFVVVVSEQFFFVVVSEQFFVVVVVSERFFVVATVVEPAEARRRRSDDEMDLFHMRRFDPEKEEDENKTDEKQLLERLKAKVAKRKADDQGTKRKNDDQDGIDDVGAKVEEKADETEVEKKKKKRKKTKKKKAAAEDEEITDFTVLGEDLKRSRTKVQRVLPAWLSNPDVVSVDLSDGQMPVSELPGLDAETVKRLAANGVRHFFPVQRQVIPWLLSASSAAAAARRLFYRPSDICVSAPTGSGKTLAFVLPIVQALRDRVVPRVRALVVLPTHELARQVAKVFHRYASGTRVKVSLLSASGQKSFAAEQAELVRAGVTGELHGRVDVVVATPGRLVDHIQKTRGFELQALRFLVIDEADRVMDDVQNDWLFHVESSVYCGARARPGPLNVAGANKREIPLQKLLFSATLSQNPEKLQQMNLFQPRLFTSVVQPKDILAGKESNFAGGAAAAAQQGSGFIGKFTTPAELSESCFVCADPMKKPLYLHHLISTRKMSKTLIFASSGERAHFLAVLLSKMGVEAGELSSALCGAARSKALARFRAGASPRALVATDALARGIDIGHVDYVVSYDCPAFVKTYVHRVGRTARAGRRGAAVTLLDGAAQAKKFRAFIKEAGKGDVEEIKVEEAALDEEGYRKARSSAQETVADEKLLKKKRRKGQTKNAKQT